MMKLDKKLKIKSAKISFFRIYIYREGDLRDEDLFVHRLLSPLFAVFVCGFTILSTDGFNISALFV